MNTDGSLVLSCNINHWFMLEDVWDNKCILIGWRRRRGGEGSVDKERAGELHEVEGRRELAAFAVQVGLHM